MVTVKFNEGTKKETKLDLQDGEEIIFVRPPKNTMFRNIPTGCLSIFTGGKTWIVEMVITNKRLVTIPIPPNKKNFEIESYYFKDMASAKSKQSVNEGSFADFSVSMNTGGSSKYLEGGVFRLRATVGKIFLNAAKELGNELVNTINEQGDATRTDLNRNQALLSGASHYTAIKTKASKMDHSKSGHQQVRNYMVDLINECIEAANK
jgi:hypothetical protein